MTGSIEISHRPNADRKARTTKALQEFGLELWLVTIGYHWMSYG